MKKELYTKQTFHHSFEYDPADASFQEALSSYRSVIDSDGTEEEMISHIAYSVSRFGKQKMIEGVGYVSENGKSFGDPYSGIDVEIHHEDEWEVNESYFSIQ